MRDLRIGQPVDLYVDMYGGRHVFKGRVSGFTMGTGSTLALLPPENATGNFVKVVQRLPVRIELEGYDPSRVPPIHRHFRCSLCLYQQAGDRTRRREVSANPDASAAGRRSIPELGWSGQMTDAAAFTVKILRSGGAHGWWLPWSWCRPSWRCSTRLSRWWRCAISPAACRLRSMTVNGFSPATLPPTPSSCRSPAG